MVIVVGPPDGGSPLLAAEMGGTSDYEFLRAAIIDLDLVGPALAANDLAGMSIESRVELALGNTGVESEMNSLPDVKLLYLTLRG